MFHDGDLQGAIATALQRKVPVVCFVTDGSSVSEKWENEWLPADNVASPLQQQAVPIRITAGSQEATLLAAFCPIKQTPVILIINNGQLVQEISDDVNQDDFTSRLLTAVKPSSEAPVISSPQADEGATLTDTTEPQDLPPLTGHDLASTATAATTETSLPPLDSQPSASTLQNMLDERKERLDAHRKTQEEAAKAERIAKRRADQEAREQAESSGTIKSGKLSYQQEQVIKKREARQERERILRIIENDKIERKEKEERRRALVRAEAEADAEQAAQEAAELSESQRKSAAAAARIPPGSLCLLQVRLLDGSTIRASFTATQNVAKDVRAWIDETRSDGTTPYVLKQIILPQPSRTLSESEETETLRSLGLAPSATLILVPVPGYVSAYTGGRGGFVANTFGAVYGFLFTLLGSLVWYIKFFLGVGAVAPSSGPQGSANAASTAQQTSADIGGAHDTTGAGSAAGTTAAPGPQIRIRTLKSQQGGDEKKDNQQLYNGNQLNFEPRARDDEDEKTQ